MRLSHFLQTAKMKCFLLCNFPNVVIYLVNWRKVVLKKVFQFCSFQKMTQTQLFCTKIHFFCNRSGLIFFMYWIEKIQYFNEYSGSFFKIVPKKKKFTSKTRNDCDIIVFVYRKVAFKSFLLTAIMKCFLLRNFPYVVIYLVNWRKVAPKKVFQFCS